MLTNIKNLIAAFRKYVRLIHTIFPVTTATVYVALFYYVSYTITQMLFFRSIEKLSTIFGSVLNFFYDLIMIILFFAIENYGFFLILLCLVGIGAAVATIEKWKRRRRFPVIGIPNKDNITVLIALFKIRCLEISRFYSIIRNYQSKANEGNWIALFLKDHLEDIRDVWDHDKEARIIISQEIHDEVSELLNDKFNFSKFYFSEDDEANLKDLELAFISRFRIYDIEKLQGIRTYGILDNTLSVLIREYEKLNSQSSALFIHDLSVLNFFKFKDIRSYSVINDIWKEIIFSLRSSVVFMELKNEDFSQILEEIEALEELQGRTALRSVIMQKNAGEKNIFAPSEKAERLIINQAQKNPLQKIYTPQY